MSDYGLRRCVVNEKKSRFRWWEMFRKRRKEWEGESKSVFALLITLTNCVFFSVWSIQISVCNDEFQGCGGARSWSTNVVCDDSNWIHAERTASSQKKQRSTIIFVPITFTRRAAENILAVYTCRCSHKAILHQFHQMEKYPLLNSPKLSSNNIFILTGFVL